VAGGKLFLWVKSCYSCPYLLFIVYHTRYSWMIKGTCIIFTSSYFFNSNASRVHASFSPPPISSIPMLHDPI
jgi:hypothetical protein